MTAATPHILNTSGACSLLEPIPKFFPATTKSPVLTLEENSFLASSRVCFASSDRFDLRLMYLPGVISSVLMLSPSFHALPVILHTFSSDELSRVRNVTSDCGCCRCCGRSQIRLGFRISSPSREVPVGAREYYVIVGGDSAKCSEAYSTAGRGDYCSRFK